jgi:hypothetical protein
MSICMSKATDADPGIAPTGTPAGGPSPPAEPPAKLPKEIGGPPGPEPTRFGDWQYKGRCTDF